MKAIQTQLQINRVSIKKDDSISFSAVTPALNDEQLSAFRKISKLLVNALFEAEDGSSGVLKINEPIFGKSPSQRLKAVLFVLWKQLGERENDFDVFYRLEMEKLIDNIKEKLE
jgi:hypothetical protein